jgi:hypothetical protein
MRIGQRLQQYPIDQTKNGRVSADTEPEDQDGGDGETRRLEEETDGVAERESQASHSV